ncbi:MAG: hypothetical protein MUP82_11175 [Candidatus Marinimicrobia bacterium]|nr:hypothetical protein [Candidatus Neomarinimicrobiota bacterium]
MKILLFITLLISISIAEEIKFSALAYYEYSYYSEKDANISNEFEFRRVYFGFEKKISNTLSYKFLTDAGRRSEDGRLEVYIKNAKVDWNTQIGKFVIGMQGMNVFDIQKNTWGYRSIDKTAMNKNNWASSADIGLGYYNNYNRLNYNVLITNGTGFKLPENDSYKKLSTQVYFGEGKLNSKDGLNSGFVFTYEPYHSEGGTTESKFVAGLFSGYAACHFRIGAEFGQLMDSDVEASMNIISGYGNYSISNQFDIFARLDNLDNNSAISNYAILGVAIYPEKGLKIMPNIRYISNDNSKNIINYNLNFEFSI